MKLLCSSPQLGLHNPERQLGTGLVNKCDDGGNLMNAKLLFQLADIRCNIEMK